MDGAGKYLYAVNQGSNNVSAYAVDAATGALKAVAGSPFAAGRGAWRPATDPAGKFLFVVNQGANNVSVYAINADTGALTPVPGSPFATGGGPTGAAVDRSGKWLVVTGGSVSTIWVYALDTTSGALTPAGTPISSPRAPYDVVMDPGGRFVWVPNLLHNSVSAYALNADTGALTPVPGSPFASGGGPGRAALAQPSPAIPPPVVARAVTNAASGIASGFSGYGVAPGSLIAVSGMNLGPAVKTTAGTYPLATLLGGTSVTVKVGGVTASALPVTAYVDRVVALLPSSIPAGDGTVAVTYNDRTSAALPIRVLAVNPGIFTRNDAGTGAAVARNYNSDDDQPANSMTSAAHPGQTLVLRATGLGAIDSDETLPGPARNLRDDVEVWVGNRRVASVYAGRSADAPGVDEVRFALPNDVPVGCYVPVAVRLATAAAISNFASVAIAGDGNVCSDPHALGTAEVSALDTGSWNIGWIQLLRLNVSATLEGLGAVTGLVDSGWAEFFRWDAGIAARDWGLDLFSGRSVSLGGCSVYNFVAGSSGYIPTRVAALNGGVSLSLASAKAKGTLAIMPSGGYEAHKTLGAVAPPGLAPGTLPAPFLEPGTITVDNGGGGSDVGAFQATLAIPSAPAALEWTNLSATASAGIDRNSDLTLTWKGGDAATEYVVLIGAVFPSGITTDNPLPGSAFATAFACTERAGAGQFTVPAAVLSVLPASSTKDPTSGVLMLGRAPLLSADYRFTAPGLDFGYLTEAVFNAVTVPFK